ncbi:eukaryotic translation initiation factor 5 [Kalmusia sp. IMI 367209]|nr:eukaryotic translation initiation factor 5 [Kalmusia sp. IMI 367209]
MATINVRRDVTDPFYRYKMERLQSKIEGKGNGIKTVIVNLTSVANSLERPPAYVIKYFGFELGAQTNTNPADDRWIINGAHDASKLQDYLDGFISKFVLCKKCKNPETVMEVKDGRIKLDCKACGQVSDVDLRLKLSSFILKNQPKKGKKDKSTKKAERRARKEAEANDNDASQNGGSPGDSASDHADENGDYEIDAGSDDELTRRIQEGAADIDVEPEEEKEIKWATDFSADAVKSRSEVLPEDLKRAAINPAAEDAEDGEGGDSVYDVFGKWILDTAAEKGSVDKLDSVDVYVKAKELAIESKHRTLTVLAQTIFDKNIVKQIDGRASMLKKMITSEKHEKAFLGGTERFVGLDKPELIPNVSAILVKYYENDLISEEVLKGWGSRASKKYVDIKVSKTVRKSAEKFMEWLNNAESDEEEDEDSE